MKKSGKFLGILLAVCMVITMNAVRAYADSGVQDTKWDDYAATEFAGGTGTKDDPSVTTAESPTHPSRAFWTATVRRYQVWWLIRARINNLLVCLVIYPMQRRATK